jgi:hypothetical protein
VNLATAIRWFTFGLGIILTVSAVFIHVGYSLPWTSDNLKSETVERFWSNTWRRLRSVVAMLFPLGMLAGAWVPSQLGRYAALGACAFVVGEVVVAIPKAFRERVSVIHWSALLSQALLAVGFSGMLLSDAGRKAFEAPSTSGSTYGAVPGGSPGSAPPAMRPEGRSTPAL